MMSIDFLIGAIRASQDLHPQVKTALEEILHREEPVGPIDSKKVIKGLEQFKADFKPFCGNGSDWARVDDAISLLKEQEAHLLDISEIYTAQKLDVWIEGKCDNTVYPLMLVETEMTDKRQVTFFFPMTVRPVKAYGKTWRCWSARPTDEQMKAVKWNEQT